MANVSAAVLDRLVEKQTIPKSKRKLQKHLRSAGLAYISRTGKLIPAKRVADELCQCPQKCDERVPTEARERLFAHFYGLGEADLQNQFLRDNMDLRARLNVPENSTNSGRPPRRITCKYLVPLLPGDETVEVCQKAFVSAFVITTKRVRLQREKLISSLGLNSYSSHNRSNGINGISNNSCSPVTNSLIANGGGVIGNGTVVVTLENQKNSKTSQQQPTSVPMSLKLSSSCEFVEYPTSLFTTSSKNSNASKEPKMIPELQILMMDNNNGKPGARRLVDDPLIPVGLLVPDGVTIAPVTATPDHDRDIAIVNNFFSNQLWKPEYIGTYS